MNIIGINGLARTGKSTVANILVKQFGFNEVSFAAPIYKALEAMFPEFQELVEKGKEVPSAILCGKSPRYLLQTLGTEWGRNLIDEHIWIRLARRKIQALERALGSNNCNIVISDVRFNNEADLIRSMGGTILLLKRSIVSKQYDHVSENGIKPGFTDYQITNDGTIKDLSVSVYQMLLNFNIVNNHE